MVTDKWSEAMSESIMMIDGRNAVIKYDPEIELFRGEFVGLNGNADFYADNIEGLKNEGATSLKVFFEMCAEKGLDPIRHYSGKFNLRIKPALHERLDIFSTARGFSLNKTTEEIIEEALDLAETG
jgi:predicted HicB family RNase H-like nuclease